jgi:hypothetical protein
MHYSSTYHRLWAAVDELLSDPLLLILRSKRLYSALCNIALNTHTKCVELIAPCLQAASAVAEFCLLHAGWASQSQSALTTDQGR